MTDHKDKVQLIDIDASATQSADKRLRNLDFELMLMEEMTAAKAMLARQSLPVKPLKTRRIVGAIAGPSIEARVTMRAALRHVGEGMQMEHRKPSERWPNLIVL